MHTAIYSNSYEYIFRMKIAKGADNSVPLLFYSFTSPKTCKTYYVHVEIHPNNFFAVKFFLKDFKKDKLKYNIDTHLNEAPPVIFTCIAIMLDVNDKYPDSSFGFIGSNSLAEVYVDENGQKILRRKINEESEEKTRRYRIYRRLMLTFFSSEMYTHLALEEKSTYLLVRQTAMEADSYLLDKISEYFAREYSYFE